MRTTRPHLLVLSHDRPLRRLAYELGGPGLRVTCRGQLSAVLQQLSAENLRVILLDDAVLGAAHHGLLVSQLRRWAPAACLLYLAHRHDAATERQVRAFGVNYYSAKSTYRNELRAALEAFLSLDRSHLYATRSPPPPTGSSNLHRR
ncbi:MAG TPA: hypothetical protein VKV28_17715 [Candidatus Binataceae bacterium]|nr:hypothetical protein [Candidatus Binataceae bacterium]